MKIIRPLLQKHLFHIPSPSPSTPKKQHLHSLPNFHHQFNTPHLITNSHHHRPYSLVEFGSTVDSINAISSDPCLFLLGFCNNIASLKRIHAQLIVHGLTHNLLCQTKLVSLYGFFGNVDQAWSIFEWIINPDLYSWKVMVRWYFLNDSYSELIQFYERMKQCLKEHDNVISSIMLKACTHLRDSDHGMKLHCQIVKVGSPDSFVLTGLIDMYAKCGMVRSSRLVFDEISERNVVSWTSMIVGYMQNDCMEDGLALFNQMILAETEPNQFTIGSLLTACSKLHALHQGKWVHGYMIKKGIELNSFVVTALLDVYVKCGTVADARLVFDELSTIDLVSWTTMIVGYAHKNYPVKAWVGSVLSACAKSCNLNLGRLVHVLGIKLRLEEEVTVRNALVDMYVKCGMLGDVFNIFERILHKDVIAWNAMISGYSQNGLSNKALSLFHQMRSDNFLPDVVTVVSALSACACFGALQVGSSFHAFTEKNDFLSNIYVGTALLNLYAKCGDAVLARCVFDHMDHMDEKNTVAWSAMMGGYGMHGDTNNSLALFSDMLKEELQPNDIIFTSILSFCSHTGMVGEGLKYFDAMGQEYHVIPSMKHYVCMVDLLARAGKLEDALEFIEKMPIPVDATVWGAFLHGCRLHMRLELGEVAMKRMLQLQPDGAGYYVLISNLYASNGRWNEAAKVRGLMKERQLNKLPERSFVEMDNSIHSFTLKEMSLP
ncbi:pentatricopeptide repeat-containing protein At2g03380, mitochondrial-like [Magnolia sinica]|uniref:pentatricopeptide repeat-containing protein At2g03380, mitochondrial-like n=1 Tax=Magnolia sinica TaxID=86752 RepID=UPI0026592E23|nr:pentatricopeptide repeat-containing protein At2g03380, mitochondrial-like [Magnolia sinica]